jgi:hypothetical protein
MVASQQGIQRLDVSHNCISSQGGVAIAAALRVNTSVRSLRIAKNKLGRKAIDYLCRCAREYNKVQELDIRDDNDPNEPLTVDDSDLDVFARDKLHGCYIMDLAQPWDRWKAQQILAELQQFRFRAIFYIYFRKGSRNGSVHDAERIVIGASELPREGELQLDIRKGLPVVYEQHFSLQMTDADDRALAERLHLRYTAASHREVWRNVRHNFDPVSNVLRWPLPLTGTVQLTYTVLQVPASELDVEGTLEFNLAVPWEKARARLILKQQVRQVGRAPALKLDGKQADMKAVEAAKQGELVIKHAVKPYPSLPQPIVVRYELQLSFPWHGFVADRLWEMASVNATHDVLTNVKLDGTRIQLPSGLISRNWMWKLPTAGLLTLDYVVGDPEQIDIRSYNVDLTDPVQRLTAERLVMVNRQLYPGSHCDRFVLNGKPWREGVVVPKEIDSLPEKGKLEFRSTGLKPSGEVMTQAQFEARLNGLKSAAGAKGGSRIAMLRDMLTATARLDADQAITLLSVVHKEDLECAAFLLADACAERHSFFAACKLLSSPLSSCDPRRRAAPTAPGAAEAAEFKKGKRRGAARA